MPRPRSEWIAIHCLVIITDETFQAAAEASTSNANRSPRRARRVAATRPSQVRALRRGTSCHKMRGRTGTWRRYDYYCHKHDPLRADRQDRRCREHNIRADALDESVFTQVRAALLDPALLLDGEQAVAFHAPVPADELLAAELARLDRRLDITEPRPDLASAILAVMSDRSSRARSSV